MMDTVQQFIEQARAEAAKKAKRPKPTEAAILEQCRWMHSKGYEPHDPVAFRRLAHWLAGDRSQGLILGGNVGTGKTMFLRLVTSAAVYTARQWAEDHNGIRGLLGGSLSTAIDDLTGEPTANHYGQREEALSDVIHQCHEAWTRHGALTYITINLPHGEDGKPEWSIIRTRYGDRTADRIREMCFPVQFEGESQRGKHSSQGGEQ